MGDGGASGPEPGHSTCPGACSERWAAITETLDRNTKLLESLLSHTIHARHLGTAPSSTSTPQGSDSTETNATATGKKRGHEFRVRTSRRHGKDDNELKCRVSLV